MWAKSDHDAAEARFHRPRALHTNGMIVEDAPLESIE